MSAHTIRVLPRLLLVILFIASSSFADPLKVSERSHFTVNYGDAFRTEGKWRFFHRLIGSALVVVEDPANYSSVLSALTNAGAPLEGFTVDLASQGNLWMDAPRTTRSNFLSCPKDFQKALERARAISGVRAANPFFIGDFLLRFAALPEITFEVQPGVDPQAVLASSDLAFYKTHIRRHFLAYPKITNEELFRKATILSLDPRVRWAEPNFHSEAVPAGASAALMTPLPFVTGPNCVPEPVTLTVTAATETALHIQFGHPEGHLILIEAAPSAVGPWNLLTSFTATTNASLTLEITSSQGFLRAIHQ